MNDIIYMSDVEKVTGLTRQTIHTYINDSNFPKPSKIGNKNAWYREDVNEWIEQQMKKKPE